MGLSFQHLLVLLVIVLLLFGRGKISELMGDFAKGVKSFKKGLADDDETAAAGAQPIEKRVEVVAEAVDEKTKAAR